VQVFFGLWLLPLGHLVAVRVVSKAIGVPLIAGCFGYLIDTLAQFGSERRDGIGAVVRACGDRAGVRGVAAREGQRVREPDVFVPAVAA
jgi:hypothetical protein